MGKLKISSIVLAVILLGVSTLSTISMGAPKGQTVNWGWATLAEYEAQTGKKITKFAEAPVLHALVDKGQLPPVDRRLPDEPLVDQPFEEVGRHGGMLRMGMVSPSIYYPASLHTMEYLLNLDRKGGKVVPNVARGWKFEDGGKRLTIYLRKNMKWSDGAPFTADDILFYWKAVILNDEVMPVKPTKYMPGGKLMTVEKVDDYTVRFGFSRPYYSFINYLAGVVFHGGQNDIYLPAHALKQYHIAYNPNASDLAKKAKYDHWWQLFNAKRYFWIDRQPNPEIPTLGPWVPKQILPEGVVYERNPYYYKIDTAGNQLPYIDTVKATIFNDMETLALRMVAGEFDYQDWSTAVSDYPVFMEGAKKGNYKVWMAPSLWTSTAAYTINQNYVDDPAVAAILKDVRFRRALSLAMNRDEMNEVFALGHGTPFQATVHPDAAFYEERWGKAYIEHDPQRANKLLDEMGMDKRDKEGFRLRPDGKPFTMVISHAGDAAPIKISEIVKANWDEVGIRTVVNPVDRSYLMTMFTAGKHMACPWAMDGAAEVPVILGMCGYLRGWQWAPLWQTWWNTKGEQGEEPPKEVKRMFALYDELPYLPDDERNKAAKELFDIWSEGLWRIGTIGMVPKPAVTHVNLGNVNTDTYTDNADVGCGTFNRLYQLFWRK